MEDEQILEMLCEPREEVRPMFLRRSEEGYFKILIEKHLHSDEAKFSEFFRLDLTQFHFVLSLIENDLYTVSLNNRNLYPITAE